MDALGHRDSTSVMKYLFLAVFIFISIIAVWSDGGKDYNAGFISAELELEEKTEKDLITNSSRATCTFVNEAEEMTFAIDRGYAKLSGSDPCAQKRALHRAGGNPARKENNHLIR